MSNIKDEKRIIDLEKNLGESVITSINNVDYKYINNKRKRVASNPH